MGTSDAEVRKASYAPGPNNGGFGLFNANELVYRYSFNPWLNPHTLMT
jgi:hypothetical protein